MLHPLTRKQHMSMAKMQLVQPEMKEIQAKYKNDREALGKAQMELWRKHGVSPWGGCLPIFLQLSSKDMLTLRISPYEF